MTNFIDTHIGAKLRKIRRSKNYILTDIANILGVTFQQYRKYETGENRISAAGLWKIAQFYEMSMDDFLPVGKLADHPATIRITKENKEFMKSLFLSGNSFDQICEATGLDKMIVLKFIPTNPMYEAVMAKIEKEAKC